MAVYFLSDYGLRDEFAGVVHAVLRRLAPGVPVVDLTHEIEPFDVRGGSRTLVRAVPWLGAGVVLAVVDPGVGTDRRGLVARGQGSHGEPVWLVGPDNGLLVPALELLGPTGADGRHEVFALGGAPEGAASTFDGRDVFAPAAAALCRGVDVADFTVAVDPASLVRLPPPLVQLQARPDGGSLLRAEITWVDRYGNLQLAARPDHLPVGEPPARATLHVTGAAPGGGVAVPLTVAVRRVKAFSDLAGGELGLLTDSAGHLAVVSRQGSAAARLGARPGDMATLVW